jgi:hypothetical protein
MSIDISQGSAKSSGITETYDRAVGDKLLDGWMLGSTEKCVCGSSRMRPPGEDSDQCISPSCPFSHIGVGSEAMGDGSGSYAEAPQTDTQPTLSLDTAGLSSTDDLLMALHKIERRGPKTEPAKLARNDFRGFDFDGKDLDTIKELKDTLADISRARRNSDFALQTSYSAFSDSSEEEDFAASRDRQMSGSSTEANSNRGGSKLQEQLAMAAYLESLMN